MCIGVAELGISAREVGRAILPLAESSVEMEVSAHLFAMHQQMPVLISFC